MHATDRDLVVTTPGWPGTRCSFGGEIRIGLVESAMRHLRVGRRLVFVTCGSGAVSAATRCVPVSRVTQPLLLIHWDKTVISHLTDDFALHLRIQNWDGMLRIGLFVHKTVASATSNSFWFPWLRILTSSVPFTSLPVHACEHPSPELRLLRPYWAVERHQPPLI